MSFALFRYCTNTSALPLLCIPSMVDLPERAMIVLVGIEGTSGRNVLTSAGVIRSSGLVHCVAFVIVL